MEIFGPLLWMNRLKETSRTTTFKKSDAKNLTYTFILETTKMYFESPSFGGVNSIMFQDP